MGTEDVPHYKIETQELARWLEADGASSWWTVDGERGLMEKISFPCPGDELAKALLDEQEPLLVLDRRERPEGKGESITAEGLGVLANRDELGDRFFELCWSRDRAKDATWLLAEDSEIGKLAQQAHEEE